MGVSTPRRHSRSVAEHMKKSLSLKRISIKDNFPTPRSFERARERRTVQKETLANLFSELKIAPGTFSLQPLKSEQKEWKVRATALQSPQVKRLCRDLQKRKRLLRNFSQNADYSAIFKRAERSKEDEEHRFMLETTMSYSPVELVARNLIDKVANSYQRERTGVWSQLGRSYSCLGVPADSIPKDNPNPKEIGNIDIEEGSSPFFHVAHKPTAASKLTIVKTMPDLARKSTLFQKGSPSHLSVQCLLLKMGLSHLHDVKYTKFPKKPLEAAENLRKAVRVKTPFSQVRNDENIPFQSSGVSSQQSIQLPSFSSISAQKLVSSDAKVDSNSGSAPVESTLSNKDDSFTRLPLPNLGGEVSEWMRQFLILKKSLQDDLNDKLMARSIRREQCRSCPPFTAEVSSRLLLHFESCGRQTPILTQQLWELAEENQMKSRPTSAPLFPELESIYMFYEKVCLFVSNQRDDDPLMEVLVHHIKELLESGLKLQKELLARLCNYMGHLPESVICTGRMSSIMPILYFICKELRVPSTDYYMLIRNSGLDRFQGSGKSITSTTTTNQGS